MTKSEELFDRAKKVSPGGVHSPVRSFRSVGGTPVFFESAEGAHLTSVEKRKYVDFCMSFGPLILGHRDPDVMEQVHDMVNRAWSFGTCEPYSVELAEWVTQNVPQIDKLRFVNSGTEAVMSAIRVARAATGRTKIVKFEGCYHGHLDSMLVKAGSGLADATSSTSAGVPNEIVQDTLVIELDDEDSLEKVFSQHGDKIAAVIIEPLPANYGLLPQREAFLKRVVAIAHRAHSLVIFDEVISGFRVAFGGMAEKLGVRPDLMTFGKVIGGGFPVGCFAGKKELLDLVAPQGPVYQAGTLSANPIGMRAGLATLKKVKQLGLHAVLEKRTATFCEELQTCFRSSGLPFQVVHEGSMFWIHFVAGNTIRRPGQIPHQQKEAFALLFHKGLDQGIYLPPSGYEVGFISAAHTEEILDSVVDKMTVICHDFPKIDFKN